MSVASAAPGCIEELRAYRLDAPSNIAWAGASLDRVVVANVGARHLSIADVGVAGAPLH